jgi:hypothetical protein
MEQRLDKDNPSLTLAGSRSSEEVGGAMTPQQIPNEEVV